MRGIRIAKATAAPVVRPALRGGPARGKRSRVQPKQVRVRPGSHPSLGVGGFLPGKRHRQLFSAPVRDCLNASEREKARIRGGVWGTHHGWPEPVSNRGSRPADAWQEEASEARWVAAFELGGTPGGARRAIPDARQDIDDTRTNPGPNPGSAGTEGPRRLLARPLGAAEHIGRRARSRGTGKRNRSAREGPRRLRGRDRAEAAGESDGDAAGRKSGDDSDRARYPQRHLSSLRL
jgi:hypothetical protein